MRRCPAADLRRGVLGLEHADPVDERVRAADVPAQRQERQGDESEREREPAHLVVEPARNSAPASRSTPAGRVGSPIPTSAQRVPMTRMVAALEPGRAADLVAPDVARLRKQGMVAADGVRVRRHVRELADSSDENFSGLEPETSFRDGVKRVQILWIRGSPTAPELTLIDQLD
jgi:hypothetical protein